MPTSTYLLPAALPRTSQSRKKVCSGVCSSGCDGLGYISVGQVPFAVRTDRCQRRSNLDPLAATTRGHSSGVADNRATGDRHALPPQRRVWLTLSIFEVLLPILVKSSGTCHGSDMPRGPDRHQPGVPSVSMTFEEASAHFEDASEHFESTFFATMLAADVPVSSDLTRALLGWEPTHESLLEDLRFGDITGPLSEP